MPDKEETSVVSPKFDFTAYPPDSLFHERRDGRDRREDRAAAEAAAGVDRPEMAPAERRERKPRRRRIDPTTFEKQYTDDELEFMNAMQQFKVQSGKTFPTHAEVLRVARSLGYCQVEPDGGPEDRIDADPVSTFLV